MPTALSSGAQKLGQPVSLSNFVFEENSASSQPGAGERAVAMLVQLSGLVNGRSVAVLAQHRVLIGRQQLRATRRRSSTP